MPDKIIGILYSEQAGSYCLTNVLEPSEDDDTYGQLVSTPGMSFINKTYVWRCQILPYNPLEVMAQANEQYDPYSEDSGGLG